MKFYGNGIVWDKQNNKRLCKFVNGEYETDDPRAIKILKFLYYKDDDHKKPDTKKQEVEQTDEGVELEEMTYNELKSLAKVEGVTVGHKSKAELITALKEGE